ncbi:MAG: recombinase RecF [Rickettsiales bacterium]|jgi:DNA replication and repair protein RecF|nr:recombinase RecF [Rickettsiales bacterium]
MSAQQLKTKTVTYECLSVASLTLTAFRSYPFLELATEPSPVILTGPNGAGKTNVLEALSFLSPGRGLRKAVLTEIDHALPGNQAAASWGVAATVRTSNGERKIGTGRDPASPQSKRIVRLDGETLKGQDALGSYVTVVWLTPQMDGLFLDAASARRKFLDRLVYHFDPEHAKRVNSYEYAMRERARLLQYGGDRMWLGTLEHTMAEQAIAIAIARRETVFMIQQMIDAATTPFPKADLQIEGEVEWACGEQPALQVEEGLKAKLHALRESDRQSGRTGAGTHRSDFVVIHRDKQMLASQCSTGEQKALLLSILLAEVRARSQWRNSVPIMLLDEVVAHLDEARRASLFDEILNLGAQCWMTGTDKSLFDAVSGRAQYLNVQEGNILPVL